MNRFVHPIISKIILSIMLLNGGMYAKTAFAQDVESQETIPKGYAKDYVFLTAPYEIPVDDTKELYKGKSFGLGLRYSHRLDSEWIVGLKFERKPVIGKKDDRALNLIVFSNQTQAIFRIYHPLYILVGTEVSLVMPSKTSTPPFEKDPEFTTEIGFGLNASLWWLVSRKGIVEFSASRWKGTKTNKLQGFELALGYGIGF